MAAPAAADRILRQTPIAATTSFHGERCIAEPRHPKVPPPFAAGRPSAARTPICGAVRIPMCGWVRTPMHGGAMHRYTAGPYSDERRDRSPIYGGTVSPMNGGTVHRCMAGPCTDARRDRATGWRGSAVQRFRGSDDRSAKDRGNATGGGTKAGFDAIAATAAPMQRQATCRPRGLDPAIHGTAIFGPSAETCASAQRV
jgi:hypothetical protein